MQTAIVIFYYSFLRIENIPSKLGKKVESGMDICSGFVRDNVFFVVGGRESKYIKKERVSRTNPLDGKRNKSSFTRSVSLNL